MIKADDYFFDRLCDRAPQPVNPQPCGADVFITPSRSDGMWTALASHHNAGHRHTHPRNLTWLLSAYICDKNFGSFLLKIGNSAGFRKLTNIVKIVV
jgi:hypothetical protein